MARTPATCLPPSSSREASTRPKAASRVALVNAIQSLTRFVQYRYLVFRYCLRGYNTLSVLPLIMSTLPARTFRKERVEREHVTLDSDVDHDGPDEGPEQFHRGYVLGAARVPAEAHTPQTFVSLGAAPVSRSVSTRSSRTFARTSSRARWTRMRARSASRAPGVAFIHCSLGRGVC